MHACTHALLHTHTQMIHLYRDPHGEAVFSGVSSPFTNAAIGLGTVSRDEGRMVALERKIRELEIKLSSYEVSLIRSLAAYNVH